MIVLNLQTDALYAS